MPISKNDIVEYYNKNQLRYSLIWSRNALHYGLWDDTTKSLAQAIVNTNQFVLESLGVEPDDTVLDAGCGVGGTSIYLAEQAGANVEGITLSPVQLKWARKAASKSKAAKRLRFSVQDFTQTSFPEGTFSKAFGIESISHAHNKSDFLKEAYRVLKPGGRLVVVDGYLSRNHLEPEENEIYECLCNGWAVPNLSSVEDFRNSMEMAGFRKIVFHDKNEAIMKSCRWMYRLAVLQYPYYFLLSLLDRMRGKYPYDLSKSAGIAQKALFERRIAIYGVFVAEK